MKYWKNGFYENQSYENDRYEISDEYWQELLNGQSNGMDITTNIDGRPVLTGGISEEEKQKIELRIIREHECFSIINRGTIWYNNLTQDQIFQIKNWYQSWLDVTETKVIPEKPQFLIIKQSINF